MNTYGTFNRFGIVSDLFGTKQVSRGEGGGALHAILIGSIGRTASVDAIKWTLLLDVAQRNGTNYLLGRWSFSFGI